MTKEIPAEGPQTQSYIIRGYSEAHGNGDSCGGSSEGTQTQSEAHHDQDTLTGA